MFNAEIEDSVFGAEVRVKARVQSADLPMLELACEN